MGLHVPEHGFRLEISMRNLLTYYKIVLLLPLILNCTIVFAQAQQNIHIIYIGDSITQGVQLDDPANNAPPAASTVYFQRLYKKVVRIFKKI
jgi:hypothetical protein